MVPRCASLMLLISRASAMAVEPRLVVTPGRTAPLVGPTFSKALSTPDPVPMAGQLRAMELMASGALFRYTPGHVSEVSLAEQAVCEYTGFKYAVGFNSCGSALFIALKTLGVESGDGVLCNAFSFTAVPSAIHHATATPVYVESTDGFVMDHEDLAKKITPETRYLMLTHMRGKVADIDKIYELAEKHDLQVVEDCAHAIGIKWNDVQLGRRAKVACFSSQSAKMINSGEGGFLCTDDEEIAAKAICYAGCYEALVAQHLVAPSKEVFDRVKKGTPNYSLRMSDLTACCVRPQVRTAPHARASRRSRPPRCVLPALLTFAPLVPPVPRSIRSRSASPCTTRGTSASSPSCAPTPWALRTSTSRPSTRACGR